ncbi:hypothetical protein [Bauldia sp.]|uniref:hypothetical protein n=1 Tax=Bauldia sp. TaxID=2575872 RepID=UPI003BAAFBFA
MLKRTIIAGLGAILIGAGALAATSTTASAGGYYGGGYVSGNGWFFGWGHVPRYKPYHPPKKRYYKPARKRVCTPKYRTVKAWKPHRGWVSRKVYAGQVCRWQPVYKKW